MDGRNGSDGSQGRGGEITVTYDPQAKPYLGVIRLSSVDGPPALYKEETVAPLCQGEQFSVVSCRFSIHGSKLSVNSCRGSEFIRTDLLSAGASVLQHLIDLLYNIYTATCDCCVMSHRGPAILRGTRDNDASTRRADTGQIY